MLTGRLTTGTAALATILAACGAARPWEDDFCRFAAPGARWLAFASRASGNYDIAISRADGTCSRVVSSGGENLFPSWSPRGTLVFATDRGGGLAIRLHDVTTGAESGIALGDLSASAPAFSPDGAMIAFEGRVAGAATTDIYVVDAAGGAPTRLTDDAASDAGPAWAPDGATIYLVSNRTGVREVFAVPSSGGAAGQVTTGSSILGRPAASPDGKSLAWARTASSGSSEVVVMDLASRSVRVVTSEGDSEPAFEPSGTRLAVRTLRSGVTPGVVVVNVADGGDVVWITGDGDAAGTPAFAP